MIDRFDGDYAFLSNFYPTLIFDSNDGFVYPTVEHFFQAKKSVILREREMIANASLNLGFENLTLKASSITNNLISSQSDLN